MMIKAVLLSLFLYPGSGHISLKKYFLGAVLMIVSSICLYILLSSIYEVAQLISTKILDGEIALDIASLHREITTGMDKINNGLADKATLTLVLCWLFGVIDSYRVGKKMDRLNDPAKKGLDF